MSPVRRATAVMGLALAALGCDDGPEPPCASALDPGRTTVAGTQFVDQHGRIVWLRGVNAGGRSKFPPFFPFAFAESGRAEQASAPSFDAALAAYVDRVVGWGHNVVRLPFSWEAVEPFRGTYDPVFVERYRRMVQAFADRGLFVVVDFHQDVFARAYCGDGFPAWAASDPLRPAPESCETWFLGYFNDEDVQGDFDRFWRGEDGLRESFSAMWTHMAATLWPIEGVIGFEIINEPGWGSMDPDAFARDVLPPFYAEVAADIRAAAPGAPVFVDVLGRDALAARTALTRPPTDGVVFAPHYYDSSVIVFGTFEGELDFTEPLGRWAEVGQQWQAPVLLGEFGAGRHIEAAPGYVGAHFDALDALGMHGTVWEYSTTVDDWNDEGMSLVGPDGIEAPAVDAIVRAFPAAIAGDAPTFTFDAVDRTGALTFEARAGGTTEIVAPRRLYAEPPRVEVDGVAACIVYDADRQRILVRTEQTGRATVSFGP